MYVHQSNDDAVRVAADAQEVLAALMSTDLVVNIAATTKAQTTSKGALQQRTVPKAAACLEQVASLIYRSNSINLADLSSAMAVIVGANSADYQNVAYKLSLLADRLMER